MTHNLIKLPNIILKDIVKQSLLEDLGSKGDITTQSIQPINANFQFHLVAREAGIIAGLDLVNLTFQLLDQAIKFETYVADGDYVTAKTLLAKITGNAVNILSGERVALNFLTLLSGIATTTYNLTKKISAYKAQITCSRKTLPGLRQIQKYAVRVGGGVNHRMGLYDAAMIKDNHIVMAGGVKNAIQQVRACNPHLTCIEVEVDTLAQLEEVLTEQVDMILLDNMDVATLTQAVQMVNGKVKLEASGGINASNIVEVAATGVDFIALGCLTHTLKYLDIGLDYL